MKVEAKTPCPRARILLLFNSYFWEGFAVPRIKSAIKRVEIAERNRERNRAWKSAIRTYRNRVEESSKAADWAATEEHLKMAFSTIDKAVSKGILHKNTAARRKSRLVHAMRKLKGA